MEQVYDNVVEAIGNTPIVRLNSVTDGLDCEIYVKLEYMNPGGSVKDRIATSIIEDAEKSGRLKPGGTIVEATSGNTGQGLAMVAAVRGYKTIFVMPDKMSEEKVKNLRAFGSKVIVTPTAVAPEDPRSYYSVSRRLSEEIPGAVLANQYHNPANPAAHYETTGPEIWRQMGDELDYFVCGLGTGGTATGTTKFLKEKKPDLKMVGVDPIGSVYLEYWKTGKAPDYFKTYKMEGVGEDFIPSTIDFQYIDHVVQVSDGEGFRMTRRVVKEEGIYLGGSGGMAVAGAIRYAREQNVPSGKKMLVILPDGGWKYLTKIFDDDWMRENGFLEDDKTSVARVTDLITERADGAVISCQASDRVRDVARVMKDKGISQLTVMDDGHLVGLVTEVALLQYMLEDEHHTDKPIEPIVEKSFVEVDRGTPVTRLKDLFSRGHQAVVVVEDGKPTGIITKIDMIDFLTERAA